MQNFEELCQLYRTFRTRNRNYAIQAAQFVRDFAAELAKQINAPKAFTLPMQGEKISYIRPLKFDPGTSSFDPLEVVDFLRWNDNDGVWEAAVGIHLELAKNAFPKTEFTIRLRFKLRNGGIDLQIPPKGDFQIKIDDRSSWQSALEHTISELVTTLNLKPWESYERKERIGFIWDDRE